MLNPLELFHSLFHPDSLQMMLQSVGWMAYVILFAIILVETGLFIFFLPGDSLLCIAGFVCSLPDSPLNFWIAAPLLCIAAIAGDSIGYLIGHKLGPRIFHYGEAAWPTRWNASSVKTLLMSPGFWFNRKHLAKAHEFYERHGGKTIIYARFVPVVRTFAPLVAGAGKMHYGRFIRFNVFGGIGWVFLVMALGYFFGQIDIVRRNLDKAVMVIIFLSILPLLYEFGKAWLSKRRAVRRPY